MTNLDRLSCPLMLCAVCLYVRAMVPFFVSLIGLARIRRRAMAIQQQEGEGGQRLDQTQAEQESDQGVSLSSAFKLPPPPVVDSTKVLPSLCSGIW